MEFEKIKSASEKLTMPDDMKHRIVTHCRTQILNTRKDNTMKTYKRTAFVQKPAVVITLLAICLTLSVSAVAASGLLKGYFQDIINWQGAVVGTAYEQATDEIEISIAVRDNELTVYATFINPQMAPYREAETLGIAAFQIVDADGRTVKEGTAESTEIDNGCAAIPVDLSDIDSGSYNLVVTAFVSEKKADQPLNINGSWECTFIK